MVVYDVIVDMGDWKDKHNGLKAIKREDRCDQGD